jgi:methylglyoxal synthase
VVLHDHKKGDRLKDTSKYSRCLELFAVAATDGQKQKLEDANLDATQVLESATCDGDCTKCVVKTIGIGGETEERERNTWLFRCWEESNSTDE